MWCVCACACAHVRFAEVSLFHDDVLLLVGEMCAAVRSFGDRMRTWPYILYPFPAHLALMHIEGVRGENRKWPVRKATPSHASQCESEAR